MYAFPAPKELFQTFEGSGVSTKAAYLRKFLNVCKIIARAMHWHVFPISKGPCYGGLLGSAIDKTVKTAHEI